MGDFHKGGVVACIDSDPLQNGMIAAMQDLGAPLSVIWSAEGSVDQACSFKDGKYNTRQIVTWDDAPATTAAWQCALYAVDEKGFPCTGDACAYADWFLPALDQLDCLHRNQGAIDNTTSRMGGGAFQSEEGYWSSTEVCEGFPGYPNAMEKNFKSGKENSESKQRGKNVRCVRLPR